MKRLASLSAVGVSLLILALGVCEPAVLAATPSGTGQALEIAPPIITLSANPGQVIHTKIQLRDITPGSLIVTNEINDFVANGEDGTPKILLKNDSNNPFSLKGWITRVPQFTLSPKQIRTVPITISVPVNASPGGHYGVIRFTGIPPELKGQGVSLAASLGALVLLTVKGKITHSLTVREFSTSKDSKTRKLFESAPLDFTVRLKNDGNIQEEPTGHIVVTDMFGKNVAGVNINVPPHNILPASIRKFTGKLDHTVIGGKKLFGLYHAKLTVTYGSGSNQKKTLTATTTFWVIPWRLIIIVVAILIVAFFALRWLIRHYNRRIISKAQGGGQQTRQNRPAKNKKKR